MIGLDRESSHGLVLHPGLLTVLTWQRATDRLGDSHVLGDLVINGQSDNARIDPFLSSEPSGHQNESFSNNAKVPISQKSDSTQIREQHNFIEPHDSPHDSSSSDGSQSRLRDCSLRVQRGSDDGCQNQFTEVMDINSAEADMQETNYLYSSPSSHYSDPEEDSGNLGDTGSADSSYHTSSSEEGDLCIITKVNAGTSPLLDTEHQLAPRSSKVKDSVTVSDDKKPGRKNSKNSSAKLSPIKKDNRLIRLSPKSSSARKSKEIATNKVREWQPRPSPLKASLYQIAASSRASLVKSLENINFHEYRASSAGDRTSSVHEDRLSKCSDQDEDDQELALRLLTSIATVSKSDTEGLSPLCNTTKFSPDRDQEHQELAKHESLTSPAAQDRNTDGIDLALRTSQAFDIFLGAPDGQPSSAIAEAIDFEDPMSIFLESSFRRTCFTVRTPSDPFMDQIDQLSTDNSPKIIQHCLQNPFVDFPGDTPPRPKGCVKAEDQIDEIDSFFNDQVSSPRGARLPSTKKAVDSRQPSRASTQTSARKHSSLQEGYNKLKDLLDPRRTKRERSTSDSSHQSGPKSQTSPLQSISHNTRASKKSILPRLKRSKTKKQ